MELERQKLMVHGRRERIGEGAGREREGREKEREKGERTGRRGSRICIGYRERDDYGTGETKVDGMWEEREGRGGRGGEGRGWGRERKDR
jgi:hypothetical protein